MIRHLLKLVWSRKRANLLLIVEIFASFLVVFAVTMLTTAQLRRHGAPLGFSWDSVLLLSSSYADMTGEDRRGGATEHTSEIVRELAALPGVEAVAAAEIAPFEAAMASTRFEFEGREVETAFNAFGDDADRVLGLTVSEGRWFDASDDVLDWRPAVINRQAAHLLFGDADPLGKAIRDDGSVRVVGVLEHFRWGGQLAAVGPAVVLRLSSDKPNTSRPTRFLVRCTGVATPDFELRAQRTMKALVPTWTVTVKSLAEVRRFGMRMALAPVALAVLVALSLMLMVMLGMVGVFWQSVARRTHEIGLRRAMGGSRAAISRHFLAEVAIITLFGCTLAAGLILQLPLIGILDDSSWTTIAGALAVSTVLLLGLATASGLYPAWMAARVMPADALHDE